MSGLLETPRAKHRLARALRDFSKDVFDLVRWGSFVGITRFFWIDTDKLVFGVLYWILSATLLAHMSAMFLLRTDIFIFKSPDQGWKYVINALLNLMICVVAFGLTLWLIELMIIGISERYRV